MGIRLNITSQLTDRMNNSKEMAKAVEEAVKRFAGHDWGILLQEDSEANYRALESKTGHILARYGTPEGDIFINFSFAEDTEPTAFIMFCSEY